MLPEVRDPRIQEARRRLEEAGLAEVVWIEDPGLDPRLEEVAAHVYHRRKEKGVTVEQSLELARDPLWFGASMVALGHADASVAGSIATSPRVIRAGLQCVGLAEGISALSSMFFLVRAAPEGDEVLTYADCGVLPEPTPAQLSELAWLAARNHERFSGDAPRVAFLSFSTKGSAEHPRVDRVREAADLFSAAHPEVPADGELQFDAAYVPDVAASKAASSPVAGRANVMVFPDLDAGNIAYKITERLGGFLAFGPLIQGLRRPCLDLSRGCSAGDVVAVAVLASLMAG